MATHWNALGEADGFMDKLTGVWLLPVIMMLFWALFEVLPAWDRRVLMKESFLEPWRQLQGLVLVLLAGLQWGVITANMDLVFPISRFAAWELVVFIAFLGRILPDFPQNGLVGVRTHKTLSDRRLWQLVHVEVGRGLRSVALLSIIYQIILPEPWNLVAIGVSALAVWGWGLVLAWISSTSR
jgi:uncharacterized membrane protein